MREAGRLLTLNPNSDSSSVSALAGSLNVSRKTAHRIVVEDLGMKSFKKAKVHRLGAKMQQKRLIDGVLLKGAFSREKSDIRTFFSQTTKYSDTATRPDLLVLAREFGRRKGSRRRISPKA